MQTRGRFVHLRMNTFAQFSAVQGASNISPFTSTLRTSPGLAPSGIVISNSAVFEVGDGGLSSRQFGKTLNQFKVSLN